jgi:hypothetical protein
MGRPDGLFKTREKASLKLGRPDGHDGRSDGLGLHRVLQSWSGAFEDIRTGCERDANGTPNGALGILYWSP